MIGVKVLEKRPVTLAEVKQLLSERKKGKDLSYEQDLTYKYSKKFAKVSPAQAEKLREELASVEGLNDVTVTKIIDLLPEKKEVLQLVIPKEVLVDEAGLNSILGLCKKYRK